MITAGGMKDGAPLLVIGLSAENGRRLVGGEPIRVKAEDLALMGLPEMEIVLVGGATEEEIAEDLRAAGWLRPDAVEYDRRKPRA